MARQSTGPRPSLRLAELVAALSLALDLGLGQPLEYFLHTCLASVRLGEVVGLSEPELADVFYLSLLRHAGCTAETHTGAAVFGDDVAFYRWLVVLEQGDQAGLLRGLVRNVGAGEPAVQRARRLVRALVVMPQKSHEVHAAHCEVAQGVADWLGLGPVVHQALGQMFERWDGKGEPARTKGEAIVLPVRVVQLGADIALFHRLGGVEGAVALARQRAGGAHDPALVERFCAAAPAILREPAGTSLWDTVLACEPGPRPLIAEAQFDGAARAIGNAVDLKTPYFSGHSAGVGALAGEAAQRCGLPTEDVALLRRAGYLQDLGRIGISSGIWQKAGPLTDAEWERVRLHPYYTERVLGRPPALAGLAALAGAHHERLDGSGYHRGAGATLLPITARLLAAADVYRALIEPRAHRPAFAPEQAAGELDREVRAGRLDGEAVRAVLAAAGHRTRRTRRAWPAGLSSREVEVVRLVTRGLSNRAIAACLAVSPRTVEHHLEHVFDKTGLTTRTAVTFFAMQHDLLGDDPAAEK